MVTTQKREPVGIWTGESPLSNWLACSLHARVWGCHGMEVALGVTVCCMHLVGAGSAHIILRVCGAGLLSQRHRRSKVPDLCQSPRGRLPLDFSFFVLVVAQQPFWGGPSAKGHSFPSGASDTLSTLLWQAAHQGLEPQDLTRKQCDDCGKHWYREDISPEGPRRTLGEHTG